MEHSWEQAGKEVPGRREVDVIFLFGFSLNLISDQPHKNIGLHFF